MNENERMIWLLTDCIENLKLFSGDFKVDAYIKKYEKMISKLRGK